MPSKRAKLFKENAAHKAIVTAGENHDSTNKAATVATTANRSRHQCPDCGYVYDERLGYPHEGFPASTKWTLIPNDWPCPDCAVREKVDFVAVD